MQFDIYLAAFQGGVLEPAFNSFCKRIFIIDKKTGVDLSAMRKVSKIIAEFKIDVINAHHYMPCFFSFVGSQLFKNKRLIYTEHSVAEVNGIYASKHGKLLRWMLCRIGGVVGVSEEISNAFRKHYPAHTSKISTIFNGIDIEKFSDREQRDSFRRIFRFSAEDFVIGTVANFRFVKNHACILRAAARLKHSYPQVKFLFIGTGFLGDTENSETEIRRMVNELSLESRVFFAGFQDDVPSVLSSLDAFCLSSYSEGMPVSVLEAMAARVPVIGSNVAGIREVVKDKETGLLFASDKDEELASMIKTLVSDEYFARKISDQAYNYVDANHAHKKFFADYAALFCPTQLAD